MTVFVFLFGLIVGSFLNVLIYRIPRGQPFVVGRSRCPHCAHDLGVLDLIPLFSFLFLRGRCRYCKYSISLQYPLVELASGLLFVILWSQPFLLFVLEILLVIAIIDLLHLVISDLLLVVLLLGGLFFVPLENLVPGLIAAATLLALWLVSRGKWIGFGDVKLAGVLGFVFGFPAVGVIFYIAVVLGGFLGAILLLLKKATMKTALPFGTFLCAGALLYVVFQDYFYAILSRF